MTLKVLYIAGAGRSGSTLLASLLGEIDGFLNIGEARYLFSSRMRSRRIPCGCGEQIEKCDFWHDFASAIPSDTLEFTTRKLTAMNFPWLVLASKRKGYQTDQWKTSVSVLEQTYHRLALESRCRLIIDASKHPAFGYALSQMPGIQLYVLHLVRDARGVVGSWNRSKRYLSSRPAFRVSLEWAVYNLMAEFLRVLGCNYLRLEYEAFVDDPTIWFRNILDFVEESPLDLPDLSSNRITLHMQHTLAGNPDKIMRSRPVRIHSQPWQLPGHLRVGVSLLTWPLLVRYGFAGAGRRCHRPSTSN